MAQRLGWSKRALSDLAEIVEYISHDSPFYAKAVARKCFERVEMLAEFPRLGKKLPEYEGEREIREVSVHSWRLIYEVTADQCAVIAVIHGARLLGNVDPV